MALLADADRVACWAELMREAMGDMPITKTQFRAVVDACDGYIDGNAAAMNTAIPQPQRAALSQSQKARIFAAVMLKRYAKGV